jgi:hypothetical protein
MPPKTPNSHSGSGSAMVRYSRHFHSHAGQGLRASGFQSLSIDRLLRVLLVRERKMLPRLTAETASGYVLDSMKPGALLLTCGVDTIATLDMHDNMLILPAPPSRILYGEVDVSASPCLAVWPADIDQSDTNHLRATADIWS